MNVETEYGTRIKELFDPKSNPDIKQLSRGFAVNETLESETILFVGINPSYRKNDQNHKESFWNPPQDSDDPYFKKYGELANRCKTRWSHIDLLGLRETKQDALKKLEKTHLGFIHEHLKLTREMLEAKKPLVIVVTDTVARKYLGKERSKDGSKNVWMGYEFEFDDDLGTDVITNKDSILRGVPAFFSSMLSGQRALDNGSFERLCWHVKEVLTKTGSL